MQQPGGLGAVALREANLGEPLQAVGLPGGGSDVVVQLGGLGEFGLGKVRSPDSRAASPRSAVANATARSTPDRRADSRSVAARASTSAYGVGP